MHTALCYHTESDGTVRCSLCRHRCRIAMGASGKCQVRKNVDGTLYSLVYGHVVAEHVDPIEKKPLYHFLPGSTTYSLATVGCNFSCLNCQNHTIAHFDITTAGGVPGALLPPELVVKRAVASGCRSISFTYTEPTIFLEYACDVARLAQQAGLKNLFVSNGYTTPEALDLIAPYLHAANIDIKGYSDEFYRSVTGGKLAEVLACVQDYRQRGIWLEITTLIIPGKNDDRHTFAGIAEFIAGSLGIDVPWHVSRFFPNYHLNELQPTVPEKLLEAAAIGRSAGLRYVYEGNLHGAGELTACHHCGQILIQRSGYQLIQNSLVDGHCSQCGTELSGVWS